MRDHLVVGLMLAGAALMLLAGLGILRMPDVWTRMSAAAKGSSLGAACMLLAVAVHQNDAAITARAVAGVAFILLTTPVAAHRIGRAAYRAGIPLWERTHVDEYHGHGERGEGPRAR